MPVVGLGKEVPSCVALYESYSTSHDTFCAGGKTRRHVTPGADNGLALLVEQALGLDPFAPCAYVFSNRRRNRPREDPRLESKRLLAAAQPTVFILHLRRRPIGQARMRLVR